MNLIENRTELYILAVRYFSGLESRFIFGISYYLYQMVIIFILEWVWYWVVTKYYRFEIFV